MIDDMSQMIKEKLLEELIEKMSDAGGDRMKPKGLGVEVQAPDKAHLAEGLDKAKDLLEAKGSPVGESESPSEEDDEQRLLALLDEDDEDKDR